MNILDKLRDEKFWVEKCINDLYFLCRCILTTLEDQTPGYKDLHYPTHKRICDFVQQYAIPGQTVLLLMPRHWIKSYIVTVGWTIQRLMKNWYNGEIEHMIISNATIDNAKMFLERMKFNIKHNPLLGAFLHTLDERMSPQLADLENKAERWTQDEIQLVGNRVETGSVEGNLVSRHYTVMVDDDLVNKDNSQTKEQIIKVVDWWKLARSLLSPGGVEIIIGTRWHLDDLYGHIIDTHIKPEKDYNIGHPIVEAHRGKYHLLQMDCWSDPEKETGSTFPVLFPEEILKEKQLEMGDEFPGQYRNDPLAKGKNKYRREWFQYFTDGDVPPIVNTVMLIDVTDKEKMTSDYSGLVVADCAVDKRVYIRHGERRKVTDVNLIDWLIDMACIYQPATIGIESTKFNAIYELMSLIIPQKIRAGRIKKGYVDYVKNLHHSLFELKHRGRPKKIRVENMHGYVEKGIVKFPREGADDLINELIRFGSSKIDDTADAFGYLYDVLEFPKKSDPLKIFAIPEEAKKTDEEKEKEDWDDYLLDIGHALEGEETDVDWLY